jgi:hypothetical protein
MVRPTASASRTAAKAFLAVSLLAAATVVGGATMANSPRAIRADDLLYFFDQIALSQQERRFNRRPKWVRRWIGPVTVTLAGKVPAGFRRRLGHALRNISHWSGERFALAADPANAPWRNRISIRVVDHAVMLRRYGSGGNVCTTATFGRRGQLRRARVVISDQYTDCLDHELMHALGFDGHWYGRDRFDPVHSVLALRYTPARRFRFTRFDAIAIRTLYHQRLWPGMPRRRALVAVERLYQRISGI